MVQFHLNSWLEPQYCFFETYIRIIEQTKSEVIHGSKLIDYRRVVAAAIAVSSSSVQWELKINGL